MQPDYTQPIAGEDDDSEFVDAAQAIVDGIGQLIALQQQTLQMMAVLAQQMNVPKKIVRDAQGRAVGVAADVPSM